MLEDDCYSVAESDIPALRALAPERVWLVGSVSKTVSAALRFGYVICPAGMGEAGRLTAQHGFFALSRPVAGLMLHLFRWARLSMFAPGYRPSLPSGCRSWSTTLGPSILPGSRACPLSGCACRWAGAPQALCGMAEAKGVLVRSADEYALVTGRAPNTGRIAISGAISRDAFEMATATLAGLLARPPSDLSV